MEIHPLAGRVSTHAGVACGGDGAGGGVGGAAHPPSGGVLNFANLTPNMNNSNALVVEVSNSGEINVSVNAGNTPAGLPVTHVRGVISGYYTFQTDQS